MTEPDGRFTLLIPRIDTAGRVDALYLRPAGSGWALPSITGPVRFRQAKDPHALRQTICEEFGLETTVLFWLQRRQVPETETYDFLTVLEYHGQVAQGSGAWKTAEAWSIMAFADERQERAAREWLAEASAGETPLKRVPWARPDWLPSVISWIDQTLAGLGTRRSGPVEQKRTWSISCMLRVPTTAGDFYYKAVPALFAREPRLTAALAAAYPGEIPDVVGVDEKRNGMLMKAFSGTHLDDSLNLSDWQGALRRYATIQQESALNHEVWYDLGCSDRRLPVLQTQIDALLADRQALTAGDGLTEDDLRRLDALAPRLKAACAELAAIGLPETLEHGDLHANNVLLTDNGYLFFDWTDGCVTHPFFALLPFLEWIQDEWHESLINSYLGQWNSYASPEKLRRAFQLARPLGALHMALSYCDIRNATERAQQWELEGGIAIFLRQLLRLQDDLPI